MYAGSLYVISSFWDSELSTSTEQTRISQMQQGSDRFVDNVKWRTQQCERVDVCAALVFLLLVWFPCELQRTPAIFAGCVLFSIETCLFAVICCVLTRCWEAANGSRGGEGGREEEVHRREHDCTSSPANRQGAAMQKTILVCNITLHCACREATTSHNSEKKLFLHKSNKWNFACCPFKVKSNCLWRSCCTRLRMPAVYASPPIRGASNTATGEVWCDRLYVSFQCMKIQTWCEIDTSSPLALSWNEWFIN